MRWRLAGILVVASGLLASACSGQIGSVGNDESASRADVGAGPTPDLGGAPVDTLAPLPDLAGAADRGARADVVSAPDLIPPDDTPVPTPPDLAMADAGSDMPGAPDAPTTVSAAQLA